jgi:carboxyl-terminal processing protease
MIDRENKIGYIRLTSFARTSARDIQKVMKELVDKEKIKGFVLDLRFNPGGLLDAANQITDLYIGDGTIVSIRPRPDEAGRIREKKFKGQWDGSLLGFPMVCLVNGYSASGSEIVSAALQDHERARIFGERSYGKGSVQNLLDFDIYDPQTFKTLKAEIKLTTATFWRPSGKNLNKASTSGKDEDTWGVTPDTTIKLSAKERRDLAEYQRNLETIERPDRRGKDKNDFKDRQLDAALQYLRGQIKLAGKVSPARDDG